MVIHPITLILTSLIISSCGNPLGSFSYIDVGEAGKAYRLSIEDAPSGNGTEVAALTLLDSPSTTLYAVSRDALGNFVQNESVTWSSDNSLGRFDLTAGSSAVYIPNFTSGTDIVSVTNGNLLDDSTGDLTIQYSVESITGLELWLKADAINGVANGADVSSWRDSSGNSRDATQGALLNRPLFETNRYNGFPGVRFDGVDDYTDDNYTYNSRTVITVYEVVTALQSTAMLAQIWGNYAEGVQISCDPRAGNLRGFSFDGNSSVANTAIFAVDGAALTGGFSANSNAQQWNYDQASLAYAEFNATRTTTRQLLGTLFPQFAVGAHQLGGFIVEVIVYDTTLTPAERITIENYLTGKYNL